MLQNSPFYAYIPARDLERARRFYEGKLGTAVGRMVHHQARQ